MRDYHQFLTYQFRSHRSTVDSHSNHLAFLENLDMMRVLYVFKLFVFLVRKQASQERMRHPNVMANNLKKKESC